MTTFTSAPEVGKIAEKVIRKVADHANLADESVHIEYVWRDEAAKKGGRVVLATMSVVTGRNAFLARGEQIPFFVLEVAQNTWDLLDSKQREALVDHELCHCTVEWDEDGQVKLGIRGHDLEEFASIVRRHGFWKSDVSRFSEAVAEQLTFAIDDAGQFLDSLDKPKDEGTGPTDE